MNALAAIRGENRRSVDLATGPVNSETTEVRMMRSKKLQLLVMMVICIFSLFLSVVVHAQNVAPATPASTYQVGAGYTSVSGPTDNGTLVSFAKQFSPRVWGVAKDYALGTPSGVNIALLNARYRLPVSALLKPNEYFDGSKWLLYFDGGVGSVKDPNASKFAWNVGAGLDYSANPTVTVQLLEGDVIFSRYFPQGYTVLSNVRTKTAALTSGLKFSF